MFSPRKYARAFLWFSRMRRRNTILWMLGFPNSFFLPSGLGSSSASSSGGEEDGAKKKSKKKTSAASKTEDKDEDKKKSGKDGKDKEGGDDSGKGGSKEQTKQSKVPQVSRPSRLGRKQSNKTWWQNVLSSPHFSYILQHLPTMPWVTEYAEIG